MKKQFVLFIIFSFLILSTSSWAQTGLNGIPVGSTTPSTGKFTNLEATTDLTLNGQTITSFDTLDAEMVKSSTTDSTSGFLVDELQGGANVTVSEVDIGGNKKVSIAVSDKLTTKGDVLIHDGTSETRLPIGASGQYLTSDTSNNLFWANPPEGDQLFNANVLLNAFRTSGLVSPAQPLKMVDGVVDAFEDETGVDTTASTNETYNASENSYKPKENQPVQLVTVLSDTNYVQRVATLTGIADGKKGTVSFWFRPLSSPSPNNWLFTAGPERFAVYQQQGHFIISLRNAAGGTVLHLKSNENLLVAGELVHVFASWDLGNSKAEIYLNGVNQTKTGITIVNDNIDYTLSGWAVGNRIGASPGHTSEGDIGQLWFNTDYVDPATELDKFYDNGVVDVASNGLTPLVFFDNFLATWQNNRGTGGSFTEVGTLGDGGPPSSILIEDITLISNSQTAKTEPNGAHIVLFAEDPAADIVLNTDVKASVSRDGGTTFTQVTLSDAGEFEKGNLLTGTVDISSQPSGTDMQWKVETDNNKALNLHGVGLEWR